MRINARHTIVGLLIAGVAGGFLFLPAVAFIGGIFLPVPPPLPSTHVAPLVGDALWAAADGGRATELQPINPFTLARFASCNVLAERFNSQDTQEEYDRQHAACIALLPAVEAINLVSNQHLQKQGVWNDVRVPFAGFATMTTIANRWTRAQLLDAVAERAEFSFGFRGVEQAAHGFFNRPAGGLTLPQAALLAGLLRARHQDPWCWPVSTAAIRRRILEKMRDNLAIDDAAFQSANAAPLDLNPQPPPNRTPCT